MGKDTQRLKWILIGAGLVGLTLAIKDDPQILKILLDCKKNVKEIKKSNDE